MKQMEPSYKGEEKFLVNDLKTIVSKARSKAFAAVNYSLVERNWRIGTTYCGRGTERRSKGRVWKAYDRGGIGCTYRGIWERVLCN